MIWRFLCWFLLHSATLPVKSNLVEEKQFGFLTSCGFPFIFKVIHLKERSVCVEKSLGTWQCQSRHCNKKKVKLLWKTGTTIIRNQVKICFLHQLGMLFDKKTQTIWNVVNDNEVLPKRIITWFEVFLKTGAHKSPPQHVMLQTVFEVIVVEVPSNQKTAGTQLTFASHFREGVKKIDFF